MLQTIRCQGGSVNTKALSCYAPLIFRAASVGTGCPVQIVGLLSDYRATTHALNFPILQYFKAIRKDWFVAGSEPIRKEFQVDHSKQKKKTCERVDSKGKSINSFGFERIPHKFLYNRSDSRGICWTRRPFQNLDQTPFESMCCRSRWRGPQDLTCMSCPSASGFKSSRRADLVFGKAWTRFLALANVFWEACSSSHWPRPFPGHVWHWCWLFLSQHAFSRSVRGQKKA